MGPSCQQAAAGSPACRRQPRRARMPGSPGAPLLHAPAAARVTTLPRQSVDAAADASHRPFLFRNVPRDGTLPPDACCAGHREQGVRPAQRQHLLGGGAGQGGGARPVGPGAGAGAQPAAAGGPGWRGAGCRHPGCPVRAMVPVLPGKQMQACGCHAAAGFRTAEDAVWLMAEGFSNRRRRGRRDMVDLGSDSVHPVLPMCPAQATVMDSCRGCDRKQDEN